MQGSQLKLKPQAAPKVGAPQLPPFTRRSSSRWNQAPQSAHSASCAGSAAPPQIAQNYDDPKTHLLICLCRELQRESGDRRFFLSVRVAANLLGLDPTTAGKRLNVLVADGVLEVVEEHTNKKARRYRYVTDAGLNGIGG